MDDRTSDEERARLAALHRYEILDTEPQEAFDRITRLTKAVMQMPMVLVNLIDKDRQWFLSSQGVPEKEAPGRDASFCIHAIRQSEPLVVNDTLKDPRFVENPRVVGKPKRSFLHRRSATVARRLQHRHTVLDGYQDSRIDRGADRYHAGFRTAGG